ncbi:hypothetical protein SODALDRAFT_355001 [Sodiomyces alkalinus F11]|uniref:Uncharacterized protein n=1 Tax=Sodiomyces alkalinus (strain CBS 110278 / VKM F-3762 / F11) TaxID=1314773 RepID=A0A3N2Q7Q2_SODAK|nr:hypothetical protein SODALDRAFT_355001 [Sodiomyces alkalinus F11]ROT42813.1 hypothetical protein SODALDRAFT_355001 [Sodiomyces alkalinus F11]
MEKRSMIRISKVLRDFGGMIPLGSQNFERRYPSLLQIPVFFKPLERTPVTRRSQLLRSYLAEEMVNGAATSPLRSQLRHSAQPVSFGFPTFHSPCILHFLIFSYTAQAVLAISPPNLVINLSLFSVPDSLSLSLSFQGVKSDKRNTEKAPLHASATPAFKGIA